MTEQYFHYDEMVQKALLGVVRNVLEETVIHGLPGDHHFYIAFHTEHPGVNIPNHLRERYKDEMTIVLQNQFWDLKVEDTYFEVGLSFNGKPALLSIPFDAVTGFLDPSVEFGLQFQRQEILDEDETGDDANTDNDGSDPETDGPDGDGTPPSSGTPDGDDEANVVTLDAFRKKK